MGLDATVRCGCIENGLKIPEKFQPYFYIDEDDNPGLDIGFSEETKDLHNEFWAWTQNACPHAGMNYVCERVSNWAGVRLFQKAISQNEGRNFPALLAEIPDLNGGTTSSEAAKVMLEEIEKFSVMEGLGKTYVLLDGENGEIVWEFVSAYAGVVSFSNEYQLGVDDRGFFIWKTQVGSGKNIEVFRSQSFTQKTSRALSGNDGNGILATFTDVATGAAWNSALPVAVTTLWPDGKITNEEGKCCFKYPERLNWESRIKATSDFAYILDSLRILCSASVQTGNPIAWC